MTDLISDEAVALSLMREALTLLDEPSNTDAATLLGQAIDAVERLISGEQGVATRRRPQDTNFLMLSLLDLRAGIGDGQGFQSFQVAGCHVAGRRLDPAIARQQVLAEGGKGGATTAGAACGANHGRGRERSIQAIHQRPRPLVVHAEGAGGG